MTRLASALSLSLPRVRGTAAATVLLGLFFGSATAAPPSASIASLVPIVDIDWPAGTALVEFENVEGLIIFGAHLRSTNGADTTALLAFDSGAGYLALDHELAWQFGLTAKREPGDDIELLRQPLQRLSIGSLQIDYVTPIITYRGLIVQSVTDRDIAGLLGQHPLTGRAIWIDYAEEQFAIVPVPQVDRNTRRRDGERVAASRKVFGEIASARAMAMAIRMEADGKILIRGRVSDPAPPKYSEELTLIVDTGATWSVLSEDALRHHVMYEEKWETIEGYSAPTLFGDESARVSRIPRIQLRADGVDATLDDVDTAILGNDLFQLLSRSVGVRVHGLVGYTFLKEYRVGIDYVNQVLWLDPMPEDWEHRPYRDSHVGVLLHRKDGAIRIEAILKRSPAEEAGLQVDDEIVAVDGKSAGTFDVISMLRYFEGRPGSQVDITILRDGHTREYMIVRRGLF